MYKGGQEKGGGGGCRDKTFPAIFLIHSKESEEKRGRKERNKPEDPKAITLPIHYPTQKEIRVFFFLTNYKYGAHCLTQTPTNPTSKDRGSPKRTVARDRVWVLR